MNAAIFERYGAPEVLQIKSLSKPAPKAGEILIRVHAATVNSADVRLRKADPFAVRFFFGLFSPSKKVLGGTLSGVVEAVGEGVQNFKPGDAIFGATNLLMGAHAEYCCLPATAPLALKPENLSHEEAAALVFGGMTAFHFLKKADVQAGQKVLIYGASGAVGSAAVQIARYMGAEVTAVCSAANAQWVTDLGAQNAIDYAKTDFSAAGGQYDVVYETVGKAKVSACFKALKKGGKAVLGATMLSGMFQGMFAAATSGKKMIAGVSEETLEKVEFLKKLAESGALKPVVDRVYSLQEIVAAHRHVEAGHKKGAVVLKMEPAV